MWSIIRGWHVDDEEEEEEEEEERNANLGQLLNNYNSYSKPIRIGTQLSSL